VADGVFCEERSIVMLWLINYAVVHHSTRRGEREVIINECFDVADRISDYDLSIGCLSGAADTDQWVV